MNKMSGQDVCRVCKRVTVSFSISRQIFDNVFYISPTVQLLKSGPKARVAIAVEGANSSAIISTVDGFDLAVCDVDGLHCGLRNAFKPNLTLTRCLPVGGSISTCSNVNIIAKHCDYSYKMMDRLMNGELWPENGAPAKFADIEFLVSGVDFKAHRAVVCARSAVFAAMFTSGMGESETGRVEITDVSPETFADFLRFVYTGQLDTACFANSQLGYCADKYQVETLGDLCRGSIAGRDSDILKSALMSSRDSPHTTYENNIFFLNVS